MTDIRAPESDAESGVAHSPGDVVDRERSYWEAYEDLDWASDGSKADAAALIPSLRGDVLEVCFGSGTLTRGLAAEASASYGEFAHILMEDVFWLTQRRIGEMLEGDGSGPGTFGE